MQINSDINWALVQGDEDLLMAVRNLLTFKSPAAKYSPAFKKKYWDGMVKLHKVTKEGVLIRSGLVTYVVDKLVALGYPRLDVHYVSKDLEIRDKDLSLLRFYQQEAVRAVWVYRQGIIVVPTGGGKTWIGLGLLKSFKYKRAVFLLHRQELMWQTYDLFKEHFPSVGRVGAGLKEYDHDIVIGMVQTLSSMSKKAKFDPWFKDVELMVIDEAHHAGSTSYQTVVDKCEELQVKVGMTGSAPEGEDLEALGVLGMLGGTVYSIPISLLVELGYVVAPRVTMYRGSWNKKHDKIHEEFDFMKDGETTRYWTVVRERCLIQNLERNLLIKELSEGKQGVLVIVDMVEHGRLLSELIGCPFSHGGAVDRKGLFTGFRSGKIPILVASPIMDEGVDIAGIRTVILASGGMSYKRLLQRIGRGMRLQDGKVDVHIIDFEDTGVRLLEKHAKARMKVYKKNDFPISRKDMG